MGRFLDRNLSNHLMTKKELEQIYNQTRIAIPKKESGDPHGRATDKTMKSKKTTAAQ